MGVRTSQHPSTTMVTLLGRNLPDRKLVKIAIRQFVGVGETVSRQIMARLQLHDQLKVGDLSETQLNSLGTILSTPQAAARSPVRVFGSLSNDAKLVESPAPNPAVERVPELKIDLDVRRYVNAQIARHRQIGTLRGRRHALGLPVRGQRTQTNRQTARYTNRLERRQASTTAAGPTSSGSSVLDALFRLHPTRTSLFQRT